jgi:hypothetical protein
MIIETTLITGASSGIGLELARLFAADKSNLVLVARSEDKLTALAAELRAAHGVEIAVVPQNLALPGAAEALAAELDSRGLAIDVLVNNAGFGANGAVADLSLDRQMNMVALNVTTLTALTRLLLPGIIERNRGGVLNLGSTAAFQAGPYMAVYYATKAYVLSFTEALYEELADTELKVSCLCPGATKSEFASAADLEGSLLFKRGVMEAATVARIGYRGFRRGRAIVVPGFKNRAVAFIASHSIRSISRKVASRLQRVDSA